jgi:signal transduction histidine kinase
MKTKINLIVVLIILSICSSILAQVFMTKITSIQIDDSKVIKHEIVAVKLKEGQSITFEFDHGFENVTDTSIYYEIFINSKLVQKRFRGNEYTFVNLAAGSYLFKVQAFNGNEQESVSAEKKFMVVKEPVKQKAVNETDDGIPLLTVGLVVTIVALIIIIVFLLIKPKSTKRKSVDEMKESSDNKIENELEELKNSCDSLKRGFKKVDEENKRLKKTINYLNKTIQSLEEANVSLIEQKELLATKKIQLEDLQKQKDELLAIKFHDLKNPANAIKGLVELLEDYDLTAQEQQEIMTSIVESSGNMIELVQAITEAFAKEKFDDEYILELAYLQDVIQSVVTMNAAYAKKKDIRLLNNASSSMPEFKFDKLKIKEALDNLVNNAVKYSLADTDVTVHSYMTDTKVIVEVKDNGVGMSKNDLLKLFEKGAKLTPQPTGGEKSSGLGLWIVKKIIDGHGGKISCESKKGIGTKFTFELPFKK